MALDKARIRFRKSGDLRLVSHLDLLRSLERMLRRAAIPFRMTEGFHPTPRLVSALSLPLGVIGHSEVAELELTEEVEPDEILRRLREQAPPGIEFLSAKRIPIKTTARPRRAVYRIAIGQLKEDRPFQNGESESAEPEAQRGRRDLPEHNAALASLRAPTLPVASGGGNDIQQRCDEFLIASEFWSERERPRPRRINIRPYVDSLSVDGNAVLTSIWITQEGSAR